MGTLCKCLTTILGTYWTWHALTLDIRGHIRGQKKDTLYAWMHKHEVCVFLFLLVLSSIAGLIDFGMTACFPLYILPSTRDNSSLKVSYLKATLRDPISFCQFTNQLLWERTASVVQGPLQFAIADWKKRQQLRPNGVWKVVAMLDSLSRRMFVEPDIASATEKHLAPKLFHFPWMHGVVCLGTHLASLIVFDGSKRILNLSLVFQTVMLLQQAVDLLSACLPLLSTLPSCSLILACYRLAVNGILDWLHGRVHIKDNRSTKLSQPFVHILKFLDNPFHSYSIALIAEACLWDRKCQPLSGAKNSQYEVVVKVNGPCLHRFSRTPNGHSLADKRGYFLKRILQNM